MGKQIGELQVFVPIMKVDEEKRLIYGVLAEERLDKSGEIFDYERSKPHFEKWSGMFKEATGGKSAGNLRVMHTTKVAGHFEQVTPNDTHKRIDVVAKITDDQEWKKVLAGDYTGLSIGGAYKDRWEDGMQKGAQRYEAAPSEGSLVDNPCMFGATFSIIKSDGSTSLQKFVGQVHSGPNIIPEYDAELNKAVLALPGPVGTVGVLAKTEKGIALAKRIVAGDLKLAKNDAGEATWDEMAVSPLFQESDGVLKRVADPEVVTEVTVGKNVHRIVTKTAAGLALVKRAMAGEIFIDPNEFAGESWDEVAKGVADGKFSIIDDEVRKAPPVTVSAFLQKFVKDAVGVGQAVLDKVETEVRKFLLDNDARPSEVGVLINADGTYVISKVSVASSDKITKDFPFKAKDKKKEEADPNADDEEASESADEAAMEEKCGGAEKVAKRNDPLAKLLIEFKGLRGDLAKVAAGQTTDEDLKATLNKLGKSVDALAKRPAQFGSPVGKEIGHMGGDGNGSGVAASGVVDSLNKAFDAALQKGGDRQSIEMARVEAFAALIQPMR